MAHGCERIIVEGGSVMRKNILGGGKETIQEAAGFMVLDGRVAGRAAEVEVIV